MWFTSDNAAPAHPAVIDAVVAANQGSAGSYGSDAVARDVVARLRALFEAPEAAVHLVAPGTAANALALACLCPPWATVFAHRTAHAEVDECGAPEFYTGGAKITLIDGPDGKIGPDALARTLAATGATGVHNVQPGALTLTNATEAGTLYSVAELAQLSRIAKDAGCPVHLDGARFANAVAALGCTPAEMTWKAGIDAVSFGGTKNGLMGVEAILLFDPEKSWELELRRKRGGHLFSKYRYLAAQMQAYLDGDLWLSLAAHANRMAARLSQGLLQAPGTRLLHPTEANAVFAGLPASAHHAAEAGGARYYLWPAPDPRDGEVSVRLMCSWTTTEDEVDALVRQIQHAA